MLSSSSSLMLGIAPRTTLLDFCLRIFLAAFGFCSTMTFSIFFSSTFFSRLRTSISFFSSMFSTCLFSWIRFSCRASFCSSVFLMAVVTHTSPSSVFFAVLIISCRSLTSLRRIFSAITLSRRSASRSAFAISRCHFLSFTTSLSFFTSSIFSDLTSWTTCSFCCFFSSFFLLSRSSSSSSILSFSSCAASWPFTWSCMSSFSSSAFSSATLTPFSCSASSACFRSFTAPISSRSSAFSFIASATIASCTCTCSSSSLIVSISNLLLWLSFMWTSSAAVMLSVLSIRTFWHSCPICWRSSRLTPLWLLLLPEPAADIRLPECEAEWLLTLLVPTTPGPTMVLER
mmetsp:Transcript_7967/g.17263  ORF Transcript_7967/g.17263 Transcript_7967/m.17263 type:complete len:344 (-) Transcript_7967:515-1546(-)